MNGTLLSQDFLTTGITLNDAWKHPNHDAFIRFETLARTAYRHTTGDSRPNEAATESELIFPTLEALGWADYLPQQTASRRGREDVPDALLFGSADAKARALREKSDERRYTHGLAIIESKRWLRPLDRSDSGDADYFGTPSAQILRYLSRVEVASDRRITWGILTNGRHWRLYWQGARSRAEQFLELDLALLLQIPGIQPDLFAPEAEQREHYLKVFWLLFRREAFLPQPEDAKGRSFHDLALDDGRHWEARVSENLGLVVFNEVFPDLVSALVTRDPQAPDRFHEAYLSEVRDAALIFLYRLLFLLYAEDRNLLPAHDRRYDDYAFRRLRDSIADRIDRADVFSATQTRYANDLNSLFRAIDLGDASIGMPPYNGGLFADKGHPVLARTALPDAVLAPLIDRLSRHDDGGKRLWINYRDLSVRHLGGIYERLLEFTPVVDEAGEVVVRPSPFARKTSGSYYTHDDLVDLLIQRTLGPLLDERRTRFREQVERLSHERGDKGQRLRQLQTHDPALAILDLKVCDPAMGSGHFLVAVVDFLADQVLEQLAEATESVAWADANQPYQSPLAVRIVNIRERILESAARYGWSVVPEQLDDRQIIRRMILKRVIFGVDKNPMAVELAKLALWLHTFTVGAPLSFLDHHLRTGDSLFGERVETTIAELLKYGPMFFGAELTRIGVATESMSQIGELTDVAIAEVQQSYHLFGDIERELKPLWSLLDFWHALRWLAPPKQLKADEELRLGLGELLGGSYGQVWDLLARGGVVVDSTQAHAAAQRIDALLRAARNLAARETFFHWELAFPTVWTGLAEHRPRGGFDAIVGNPPWDRIKLQQVEWFAAREPAIARQARASDRKRMIAALERQQAPLAAQYLQAAETAENAARVARECGEYPLLSNGDINLYSLFVERASQLVAANGVVGLITPSGIAADLGASEFFKSIATSGRLGTLFDFENRKVFFSDVHASFKFCALVFGGTERRFATCEVAFFLHSKADLDDPERRFSLSAADFAAVNPNTGTAPIFRRRRDAELTAGIYRRLPVLVDRRVPVAAEVLSYYKERLGRAPTKAEVKAAQQPTKLWPLRYATMFHMTNDSGLFKRRTRWNARAGIRWAAIAGGRGRTKRFRCTSAG